MSFSSLPVLSDLCDLILGDFRRKFQSQECDAPHKIKMFNPVNNFFVGIMFNFYGFSKLLMFVEFLGQDRYHDRSQYLGDFG